MTSRPDLLILAPAAPHKVYTDCIRTFVDSGVWFPFEADYALPQSLPSKLDGFRCIMIDEARRAEFEKEPAASRLRDFERAGGQVYWPDPTMPCGGTLGDATVRHNVLRAVVSSGVTTDNPAMLACLQGMDEGALVAVCKKAAPDEFAQYVKMGRAFVDPVGMWTLPTAVEAADFFHDPSLAEPAWKHIAEQYAVFGSYFDSHGARYILQYAELTGDRKPLEHVIRVCSGLNPWPYHWRMDGVFVNLDVKAPDNCDPENPPPAVRENAWTWPENSLVVGETYPMLTRATGNPAFLEIAVRHMLGSHRWLFDTPTGLYWHLGRPNGPDKRSAPWGRGDTHFLWGIRAVLDQMPADHPRRKDLIEMLRLNLEGLLRVQDRFGLWHNVLDASPEDSRPCSSATSQIIRVYARAYHKGWLQDPRIPPMIEKAWLGFKTKIWDYRVLSWCVGTSYSLSRQCYLSRPHDSFRPCRSAILHAWIEIQRMRSAKV
jgi:hypothetical protein